MAKKFKFSLEGLLKLRKFKEESIKMEISLLQRELQKFKNDKAICQQDLELSYQSQEHSLKKGLNVYNLRFYPEFNDGKRAQIKQIESMILNCENRITEKLKEYASARGNVKVVEKIKEKKTIAFKKMIIKQDEDKRQELYQISSFYQRLKK